MAYRYSERICSIAGFDAATRHEDVHHMSNLGLIGCACANDGFLDGARGILANAKPRHTPRQQARRAGMAELNRAGGIIFHKGFFDSGLRRVVQADNICNGFKKFAQA